MYNNLRPLFLQESAPLEFCCRETGLSDIEKVYSGKGELLLIFDVTRVISAKSIHRHC